MNNKEIVTKISFATKVLVVGINGEADRAAVFKVDAPIKENGKVELVRRGEGGGSINTTMATLLRGRRGGLRFFIINTGVEDRRFDSHLF